LSELAVSAATDVVRCSQAWEDHALLGAALEIGPDDDVLSVCGAGCNVLALLLEEPRSIVAIDTSLAQTSLLELKLVALERLSHPEFAAFLGARSADDREATYHHLRAWLGDEARAYWDEHPFEIYAGVLGCGTLDRHVRAFQERFVAPLVDPRALTAFLELSDPEAQRHAFERDLAVLEHPVRKWFGRRALAGRTREAPRSRYTRELDVGGAFWRRFAEVATMLPARSNFYLEWLLSGQYHNLHTGPPFLRPCNFDRLRALADRVTIVRGELSDFLAEQPAESFAAADLSDAFEGLTEDASSELKALLNSGMQPGGRLAYWSATAERVDVCAEGLHEVPGLGDELFLEDRAPFHGAFVVDESVPARAFTLA
jgi:S-adenosylmethionine-diacylglycerol 3-amino-3-carboxypropyl transferase